MTSFLLLSIHGFWHTHETYHCSSHNGSLRKMARSLVATSLVGLTKPLLALFQRFSSENKFKDFQAWESIYSKLIAMAKHYFPGNSRSSLSLTNVTHTSIVAFGVNLHSM